jgi:hypothetical protein
MAYFSVFIKVLIISSLMAQNVVNKSLFIIPNVFSSYSVKAYTLR